MTTPAAAITHRLPTAPCRTVSVCPAMMGLLLGGRLVVVWRRPLAVGCLQSCPLWLDDVPGVAGRLEAGLVDGQALQGRAGQQQPAAGHGRPAPTGTGHRHGGGPEDGAT